MLKVTNFIIIALMVLTGCSTTMFAKQDEEAFFGAGALSKTQPFKFKILESYWTSNTTLENGIPLQKPQAKYLVVKTSITNLTNEPQGLACPFNLRFILINDRGTKFIPNVYTGTFGNCTTSAVNPGMSDIGILVFDVPDGPYSLYTFLYDEANRVEGVSFQHPLTPIQK